MMNRDGSCGLLREERGFRRVSGVQTTCIMTAFFILHFAFRNAIYGMERAVCSMQQAACSIVERFEV